jgi:hypothetical protein
MNDIDVLLILPIIVLLFSAYELGAIITKRYHTISYYAQRDWWLKRLIFAFFILSGLSGAIWWVHHMGMFIPQ